MTVNIECLTSCLATLTCVLGLGYLTEKEKELFPGKGCVEMDVPWQLCRTIGPLTLHSQEILFTE